MAETKMQKPVKWDAKGNPIVEGAKKKKRVMERVNFKTLFKEAGPAVGYGLVGAVASGIGMGIVALVPPLARQAAKGGMTRAAVVTGTSLAVAGIGLGIGAKVSTPKMALHAAPFVLGGVVLTSLAPLIAVEVVGRIDAFMRGLMNATPAAPGGYAGDNRGVALGGDLRVGMGSAMGARRRALTPSEVQSAPGGYAGDNRGVAIGGDLRVPSRRW